MLQAARSGHGNSPYYLQIYNYIKQLIVSGQWEPDSQIPNWDELAALLGVSRLTVRQALAMLVRDGYLETRRGKGTFILPRPDQLRLVMHTQTDWLSLYKVLKGASTDILMEEDDVSVLPNSRPKLPQAKAYHRIKRVHSVNGEPFGFVDLYVEQELFRLHPEKFRKNPVLTVLSQLDEPAIASARQKLSCARADIEASQHLKVQLGDPVVSITRYAATSEKLIYFGLVQYRPEYIELETDLLTRKTELSGENRSE